MAQVDTELGWSADDAYLLYSAAALMGGPSKFSDTQAIMIPKTGSAAEDVVSGGVKAFTTTQGGYQEVYLGASIDMVCGVFAYQNYNARARAYYASFVSNVTVYAATYNPSNQAVRVDTFTISNYHSASQLYYRSEDLYLATGGNILAQYVTPISPVALTTAGIANMLSSLVVVTDNVYKLNAGYAVAAWVNWKGTDNATYWTPILISSEVNNCALSLDGTTEIPSYGLYTTRYDGITFYMRYYRNLTGGLRSSLPSIDISSVIADTATVFKGIAQPGRANIQVNETIDPYAPFGNTEEGGGEVNPDPEDDDIEEPTLPGLSFAATGLCRIYRADLTALNQLANYMWTDNTFLQTLVNHAIQLIENPMDAIISLCLVPVAPPSFSVGTAEAVSVMYIPTPAAMWPVVNQFARVDCGTLDLEETYGSALDYNPYTKVSCFLPYIGFVDLDTDEVMGKTLNVVYRIDVVTGVCVAMIKVNGEVMYQFSGHCAIQMPLSSADFSTVISSLLQAGKLVAGAALTAAGAPEVGGMLLDAPQVSQPSTTVRKMVGTERNPNTGRQITTGTVTETVEKTGKPLSLGELAKRQSANTVGAIMNSKFGIEHSGGFSGNSGYLGVRRPFIIVKRPRLANPEQYGQYNGRPSMIYLNLGACTGYTEVQSVQLTGIAATNSELSEIATLLKTGVIL